MQEFEDWQSVCVCTLILLIYAKFYSEMTSLSIKLQKSIVTQVSGKNFLF